MEELLASLEQLCKNNNSNTSVFYKCISDLKLSPEDEPRFKEVVLPKVYSLYGRQILQKDLLYLALLAGQSYDILEIVIEYDKSVFSLNIEDPVSLYDFCIYSNEHWLYEVLARHESFGKLKYCERIYTFLMLLKFIQTTNSFHIDILEITSLLPLINKSYLSDFWKHYIAQIDTIIDIVKFCRNVGDNRDDNSAFQFATHNPALTTFSEYMNFTNPTQWEIIFEKLSGYKNDTETNIFAGFMILATLLDLLRENGNQKGPINALVENIRQKLLQLNDHQLQIELLENIFSLLFIRKHDEFVCKEKEIRLVFYLVKTVTEELKIKKTYKKGSEEYERLLRLDLRLTDAIWRLDLVINLKQTPKVEIELLNYMLAPAESLIHLCLRREDYERAYQVVEIFNMTNSDIAHEISYAEKALKFKHFLKKHAKLAQSGAPTSQSLTDFAREFFKENPMHTNEGTEQTIRDLATKFNYLSQFEAKNDMFLNLFDLAITSAKSADDCATLMSLAQENCSVDRDATSHYLRFHKKVLDMTKEMGRKLGMATCEILISPNYQLDMSAHREREELHIALAELYDEFKRQIERSGPGVLNKAHPSHKTLLKINEACSRYAERSSGSKDGVQYLLKVFNYLQAFSKILYIEQDTSEIVSRQRDTSFFELLNFNRSELTGKLLFEKNLDPADFERYFGRLKLDFLYHVVGNCFPTINLHVPENITIEELYHDNMLYVPSKAIIEYIQKRNWLLAFILNEMYKVEGVMIDISEARLKAFFNYLKLPRMQHLKVVFDDNVIVTAVQNCINAQRIKLYFDEQIVKHDLISINSQLSEPEPEEELNETDTTFETGEEILEDTKTTNWKNLYDIIESIPENQMRKKSELSRARDNILANLVSDSFEPNYYQYTLFIENVDLRIDTIMANFKKWSGSAAIEIFRSELTRLEPTDESRLQVLRGWLRKVELNEELIPILDTMSWYKSYEFCKKNLEDALKKILETSNIDVLLEFIELYKPTSELLSKVELNYVTKIVELNVPQDKIKRLLDSLPFNHTINICNNLLTVLRNLDYLHFVSDYLNTNVTDDMFLKNVQVSLKMLEAFTPAEQEPLFCLVNEPLNIIEVLIMNTKLDKLGIVLETLNLNSPNTDYDENVISVEKIDSLLRTYAEKSLDFRVISQPNPRLLRTPEHKLMESLDSLNFCPGRRMFVVPETVPTKEEWIKNEEVLECMCCQQVAFSMFNRRHHCRRCGRIVCYNCSQKRMLVPTYGDILVRVCTDCYDQTIGNSCSSERSDAPSVRSFVQEYWLLNDDPEHNKIMREEFSYEHAPSVSLCLSILKYHSKSMDYPMFLFEQCDAMLTFLQPTQEPSQEIDYQLVVKMIKTLALAAKVHTMEHMLNSGTATADSILSQADLLGLLADRGCLKLVPLLSSQDSDVNALVLRKLRDKLLQDEQWHLALEVSTKAGLDNTGVFAAWGKSCLKAGSLMLAREKFQRCLDKTSFYESSLNATKLSESYQSTESLPTRSKLLSMDSRASGSVSSLSEFKPPGKVPPLLHEIIQILESKTRTLNSSVLSESEKLRMSGSAVSLTAQVASFPTTVDTPMSILNRIKNLKEIASGNFCFTTRRSSNPFAPRPMVEPTFYEECIYYLSKYGTALSLLEFWIKHGQIDVALSHIIDNRLGPEVFVEIYMICLRDGIVQVLQDGMSEIDASLDLWKDYLTQICRHLEKQHLLNSLYQLQLFMGDYVRAAMTCIRFYQENVRTFTELANNVSHLYKAEGHLRQLKDQEWVEVSSVDRSSSESSQNFEETLMTSSSLVMKVESKDLDKHMATIRKQIKIVAFLADCESAGVKTTEVLKDLLSSEPKTPFSRKSDLPSLFGTNFEKICIAAMIVVCAANIDEGFKLAWEVVEEFRLRSVRVYGMAGKHLARSERYDAITQLARCINQMGGSKDPTISDMLDDVLTFAVNTLLKANITGTRVSELINLIKNITLKISALIEAKELTRAFYLASKHKRITDLRRILLESELLNKPSVKEACLKTLQELSKSSSSQPQP